MNAARNKLTRRRQDTTQPYGYIGGVTGLSSVSADLLPGSSNYAYFAGVTPSTPR